MRQKYRDKSEGLGFDKEGSQSLPWEENPVDTKQDLNENSASNESALNLKTDSSGCFCMRGLIELEEIVQNELRFIHYNPNQRPEKNEPYQVAIIGSGMAGMAIALALIKMGISKIKIYDQAPSNHEGPWATYARMKTLRTSKDWMGPCSGIPSLSFQAWYVAQFGHFAWQLLGKIPTSLWGEYLSWFKRMLNLPLQNDTRLLEIIPTGNTFKLRLSSGTVLADKVVLATGLCGFGGPEIPDFMQLVSKTQWSHTNEQIDFSGLKGKRVAVIGGGDAGFDAAATALENGAYTVDLHIRRKALPDINLMQEFLFALNNGEYGLLTDDEKAKIFSYIFDQGLSPPVESLLRVKGFHNFYFHTECDFTKILRDFDYYILATGPAIDGTKQPEIAPFMHNILLWQDQGYIHPKLRMFPYLGRHFEFLEKEKGKTPFLKNIYCFNHASAVSHGGLGSGIAQISLGAQFVAQGIKNDLFMANKDYYLAIFKDTQMHTRLQNMLKICPSLAQPQTL